MIPLFHVPHHTIDTSEFNSLLHDEIVTKFEQNFCNYVGVKYGCALNSASSAIFLLAHRDHLHFQVPTMIPPVVLNSIVNGGGRYDFCDNPDWMGSSYLLYNDGYRIIDSAQEVKPIQLYDNDLAIYSFYPTKPVSGCDGGMVVSNNEAIINWFRLIVHNGSPPGNSWDVSPIAVGWKMYMNSLQAYIANENLKLLDNKKNTLKRIRYIYNCAFELNNTSDHLYIIKVDNNANFVMEMKKEGITCGTHYGCAHMKTLYKCPLSFPNSEDASKHVVSIPFHEALSHSDITHIIEKVGRHVQKTQ